MDITPMIDKHKNVISSYGDGVFIINREHRYEGNILLFPDEIIPMPDLVIDQAGEAQLQPLIARKASVEVLLVGGGNQLLRFPSATQHWLRSHAISCDYMDTGAACRTYNILLSEERKVAALLTVV